MHDIVLIGAGKMAQAYAKVLDAKGLRFTVVGRGQESATAFEDATGIPAITGGLDSYLASTSHSIAPVAIVALPVADLSMACMALIKAGTQRILVEKPAGLNLTELETLNALAEEHGAEVRVALNRRFLASTLEVEKRAQEDGGISSFTFEFTEWGNVISQTKHPAHVKDNWFLANSLHVVDLAFHLGGKPCDLFATSMGELDWHPRASRFSGAGRTHAGAVFSYHADWAAPGRWGVEIMTPKHRFILRPLEQVQVQELNKIAIETAEIDDTLDQKFKPGLYLMVEAFIDSINLDRLPTISEHCQNTKEIYTLMLPDQQDQCDEPRLAHISHPA